MGEPCQLPSSRVSNDDAFARFFDDALPVVFGYALRLCGGDRDDAWDVTQDAWLTFVREVNRDHSERPSIAWLIRVARSRYIDRWRRDQQLPNRLRLAWAADRDHDTTDVEHDVLPWLEHLQPAHRIVLTLFYIDDLPVVEVARLMGLEVSDGLCKRSGVTRLENTDDHDQVRSGTRGASPAAERGRRLVEGVWRAR